MEVIEKMWLADLEVYGRAEHRASRCKGAAGGKKLWPCRIEKCEWMYTEPYREARNGNPGAHRWASLQTELE
jgi:hypothetical protein